MLSSRHGFSFPRSSLLLDESVYSLSKKDRMYYPKVKVFVNFIKCSLCSVWSFVYMCLSVSVCV